MAQSGEMWRVLRYYQPDEQVDLQDELGNNVMVVASVIIPRPRAGARRVQVLSRDPQILIDTARAAQYVLHGEMPVDAGQ